MILVLEGDRDSGKNIVLGALCRNQSELGKKVIVLERQIFTFDLPVEEDLFDIPETQLVGMTVVVPWPCKYTSSHTSMAKRNILFSYLIAQSRHRDLDFYIVAPELTDLDKRIRWHAGAVGTCIPSPTWNSIWVVLREMTGRIIHVFPFQVDRYKSLVKVPDLPKGFPREEEYIGNRSVQESELAETMADLTWRLT